MLTNSSFDNSLSANPELSATASLNLLNRNASPFDTPLTYTQASSSPSSLNTLEQALQLAEQYLKAFATSSNFAASMAIAFGKDYNAQQAIAVADQWVNQDFSQLPQIKVRSGADLAGANGAFSAETNTIYLSSQYLSQNAQNVDAIVGVILEETGHFIDVRINATDSPGDEGDIFSRQVRGIAIRANELLKLQAEDDHATISIDGKTLSIEMSRVEAVGFNNRLYQSIRGTDNGVYTRSTSDGTTWTTWVGNGFTLDTPDLEVFNGRLYQTIQGTDNQVYTRSTANGTTWTTWVGNGLTSDSPELEVFNNRLYQTIRGTDNQVYTRSTSDGTTWTTWVGNGFTLDTPDLEVFNGRLYQTIQGTDNQVYTRSTANGTTWTTWAGNGFTSDSPELEVFNSRLYQTIRGTDNQVYMRSTSDGTAWTTWVANGATLDAPDLEVFNGRLYQTIQGTDNQVYTRSTANGTTWTTWVGNGATFSTPHLTVFGNKLVQCIEGTDQKIYTRSLSNTSTATWNSWQESGGYTARNLTAADINDFNGDDKTDVVWRDPNGKVILWLDKDHTKRVEIGQIGGEYAFQGTGDFNRDGYVDIMWRKNTGEAYAWYMKGTQFVKSELYGGYDPTATIQGFADLNKDGKTDVIWRLADGNIVAWYDRDHTQRSVLQWAAPDITFQGTGDFNADGNIDLMWRKNSGEVYAWYMNGTQFVKSELYGGYDPSAKLQGFADLNKDGKTDVIWRLADGNIVAWYDRDATQRSVLQWAAPDTTFQGTGDFNADGNIDLMWRKNSGEVYAWYMNGNQFVKSELYGGYLSDYQMQTSATKLTTSLPSSASAAATFFKLQYFNQVWNPNGPSSSSNCGPASLAMVISTLGRAPQGISVETSIDHARYLMNPTGNAYREGVKVLDQDGVYTNFSQLETGIRNAGGSAVTINSWETLNQNLSKGNPMVVLGYYGKDWSDQFPDKNLAGSGNCDHFIAILGQTTDGKYIVADPMYKGGPVEMTKKQLEVFFRSTQNSLGIPAGRAFGIL